MWHFFTLFGSFWYYDEINTECGTRNNNNNMAAGGSALESLKITFEVNFMEKKIWSEFYGYFFLKLDSGITIFTKV